MKEIQKKSTLNNFILLSRYFTFTSGLGVKSVLKMMMEFPETSQAMLGGTAFVITSEPKQVSKQFKKFSNHILVSKIANHGAGVL